MHAFSVWAWFSLLVCSRFFSVYLVSDSEIIHRNFIYLNYYIHILYVPIPFSFFDNTDLMQNYHIV
jgi:hypothetical protein